MLRADHLGQPEVLTAAYAVSVKALIAVLSAVSEQVKAMEGRVRARFGRHPAAEIISSQPGLGSLLGARVLAEFGDDPHRYASAKAHKNYAGTSPITRASGRKKAVLARFVHSAHALHAQAFAALGASPGACAYYDRLRARDMGHHAALRQLAPQRMGCLSAWELASSRHRLTLTHACRLRRWLPTGGDRCSSLFPRQRAREGHG